MASQKRDKEDTPVAGRVSEYKIVSHDEEQSREKFTSVIDECEYCQKPLRRGDERKAHCGACAAGDGNGGSKLDILIMKVDTLAESNRDVVGKIDKFSSTLYDPKDGLFTRMKDVETSNLRFAEKLCEHTEGNVEKLEENDEKLADIQKKIDVLPEIVRWKDRVNKSAVWLASGLGTALIGLIAKMLYDYFAAKHGIPPLTK